MPSPAFLCVSFIVLSLAGSARAGYIQYNTSGGTVAGKINVHLVPHSHDDVGWLKTVDQYFVGSNNSIHGACIINVLDSVVGSLLKDPNRKFIFAEQAFFQRWWREQSDKTQEIVRKIVDSGQLEFINGGWCMHDEATVHYIDMIDQTTLGHQMIKKQFNKVPRAGWQIDPFGHSAVQAYLLGAELGFDSVHFARIDYQDRQKRKLDKSLEVIWRGSRTFGSSSQIFANAFPVHYSAPSGFSFDITDDDSYPIPVQDDPQLFDYNVEERVNDFIAAAMTQANVTRTNHIMWTMGDDFKYQYAEAYFKQMDKLIHYANKDGRVHALYSTPSIYTDAKNAENESWPLKTDDYFPYADSQNAYWTGYFTSRPSFKRYIRMLSGYYLAARQIEFLAGRTSSNPSTLSLGDALGIAQHHDAVTGTAKQHTTNDYAKRLSYGASEAEKSVDVALSCITSSRNHCASAAVSFSQCNLLNISYCPATEKVISVEKSLVVVAYNPLGWYQTDFVRIPVNDDKLAVRDSDGNYIATQLVEVDNITSSLRRLYVEAYLGVSPKETPKYWLIFQVSIPPIGWNTYFISKDSQKVAHSEYTSSYATMENETIEIGPGPFKLQFSSTSGQLKRITNHRTGVDIPINQSFLWYEASSGDAADGQASGAYIFRPDGAPPVPSSSSVPLKVIQGPLVDEVHQQFNSWIYQVIRVYKEKEHAEIEFTIGPIPTDDGTGKEVITRLMTNMVTNSTFYTDSNGRDFLKRVRDYRADWNLQVTQPVSGNYYPLNLGIYSTDGKSELSVLVDRGVGGSSIKDGEIEIMLHRRLLYDDSRGVAEALDEQVCVNYACEGLTVRGNYYLSVDQFGSGAHWRRTFGQQIYSPLLLAFAHADEESWKSSHVMNATTMDHGYNLPPNVAIITLQDLHDGSVLLRLAHLYEAGEDVLNSRLSNVDLKKVFAGKTIKELRETNLSANQDKSGMKRKKWRVADDPGSSSAPIRGRPVDNTTLVVELGPMEIRTFLLKF
ncbi:alpha-mannosidase-like [Zingiber officinale]|uniref:alpha-mannosidase-like n=1 Tax=Zingiber officinale TaxID=94328 RepID=UPI001C4C2BB5|nr:alpha-mannosidase-like [Zingiber officinale]